jgi:hypothetical protein
LEIYFDNSIIQKEIHNFVKFHEENSTNFDSVPSLQHIDTLLKEMNEKKIPNLIDTLDSKPILENLKQLSKYKKFLLDLLFNKIIYYNILLNFIKVKNLKIKQMLFQNY